MSRESVELLVDRWMNEPAFREQMREDPEGTIRSADVDLDDDEWTAVRSIE